MQKKGKFLFTENSKVVTSFVIMILAGKKTFEQVPDIFNLRELVASLLELQEQEGKE